MLLFKTISAREFIETEEPLKVLTQFNKVHFDDEESKELTKRKQTTSELVSCLEDLKVLGKKEFKKILKWRVKMRELEHLDSSSSSEEDEEEPAPLTEEEKAEQLNQEISAKLAEQEKLKRKKERKKKRLREKLKKKLGMSLLQDATPYESENPTDTEALFNLKQVKTNQALQTLTTETAPMELDQDEDEEFEESDEESDSDEDQDEKYNRELESALDGMYKRYLEASRSRRKRLTEEMRKMKDEDGEDMTDLLGEEPLGQYDPEEDENNKQVNPLLVSEPQENKSKVWFGNILHNLSGMKGKKLSDILDDEREEDEEVKRMALEYKQEKDAKKNRGQKRKLSQTEGDAEDTNGHMESTIGPVAKKLKTNQQTAVVSKAARVTKIIKGDFSDMPSLEPLGTPFRAISRKSALKQRTKSTPKTAETSADDDVNTLAAAQQFEEYYKQQIAMDNNGKKNKKNEVTFEEVPAAMSGEEDSSMEDDGMYSKIHSTT